MKAIVALISLVLSIGLSACSNAQTHDIQDNIAANDTAQPENTPEVEISNSVNNHNIEFPANFAEKTEFNAAIYDIEPFNLSIDLPGGWTMKDSESPNSHSITAWSKLDILNGSRCVGVIGYNVYEPYDGAEEKPIAIYNQIALGNDYRFDMGDPYKVVKETDTGNTAVTDVYYSAAINNGAEKINKGIISYNKDFFVYVAIELYDNALSENERLAIAESIEISR